MNEKSSFQSQVSNPWVSGERSIAAVCGAIRLAEKSGHLKTSRDDSLDEMFRSLKDSSISLHLIQQLKEITAKRQRRNKLNLEIQRRLIDKETRDITHIDVLESKILKLNALTGHLQSVIQNKDRLVNQLQQPFVGDYLSIEVAHHRHLKEFFPLVASCLAELSNNLDTIQWSAGFDMKDGKMDESLNVISTSLAHLRTSCQALCQFRSVLDKF